MAFKGITFPEQNVTAPENEGTFYFASHADGILYGCGMTVTSSALKVQSGLMIVSGRLIEVDGETTITFGSPNNNAFGRALLQIDTSKNSLEGDFQQISIIVEYSNSINGFTALIQQDINHVASTKYQVVLGVVNINGNAVVGINSSMGMSSLLTDGNIEINSTDSGERLLKFLDQDVLKAVVAYSSSGFRLETTGSNGNSIAGITSSSGVNIYSNNSSITLRPNGKTNTTGQVTIDTTGNVNLSSGNIRLQGGNGSSVGIYSGGALVGILRYNGSNIYLAGTASDGTTRAGVQGGDTNAILFSNSANVYLRPNGSGTSTGQAYLDTSGSLHATALASGNITSSGNITISGSAGHIYFANNGTNKAHAYYSDSESAANFGTITNGGSGGGVYASGTHTLLYGDNATVRIRPQGINTNTNQSYFATDGSVTFGNGTVLNANGNVTISGQQIGGHTMVSDDKASTSISAGNTVTNLCKVTGMDSSGVYMVTGYCTFAHTSANDSYARIIVGSSSTGVSLAQTVYMTSTNTAYFSIARLITGVTAQYLNFSSTHAGTATSAHISVVRLG